MCIRDRCYSCCTIEFSSTVAVCIENLVIRSLDMLMEKPSRLSQLTTKFQLLSVKLYYSFFGFSMTQTHFQEVIFFDVVVYSDSVSNTTFSRCIFQSSSVSLHHIMKVAMEDCQLLNTDTSLQESTIIFSGVTTLAANNHTSAIISYLSSVVGDHVLVSWFAVMILIAEAR